MQVQRIEEDPTLRTDARETIRVNVFRAQGGGWDVIAASGRRVIIKHYGDWHRAERACRLLDNSINPDVTAFLH